MKTTTTLFIAISLILIACETKEAAIHKSSKDHYFEKMLPGKWKLIKVSYQNVAEQKYSIDPINTSYLLNYDEDSLYFHFYNDNKLNFNGKHLGQWKIESNSLKLLKSAKRFNNPLLLDATYAIQIFNKNQMNLKQYFFGTNGKINLKVIFYFKRNNTPVKKQDQTPSIII